MSLTYEILTLGVVSLNQFSFLHLGPFYFNSFGACAKSTPNKNLGVEHMTERNPRRTDEEWLNLIQECRASGLSDKYWCEQHHIHPSNFYYHINRLRNKACDIPESVYTPLSQKQEIVPLSFGEPTILSQTAQPSSLESCETAIKITLNGFQIEITNTAASETIFNTLAALQRLC